MLSVLMSFVRIITVEPEFLAVGDTVYVSSFGKKATVLSVEPSKDEVIVRVGNIKLKLKFADIMR